MSAHWYLVLFTTAEHGHAWGEAGPRVVAADSPDEALQIAFPQPPSTRRVAQANIWKIESPRHTIVGIDVPSPRYRTPKVFAP